MKVKSRQKDLQLHLVTGFMVFEDGASVGIVEKKSEKKIQI